MQNKSAFLVLLAIALMLPNFTFADPADPYNAYLWNRENALSENGSVDRNDWYEWWYYKIVNPETREAFFLTYGVINPWDGDGSMAGTTAVVQVGDFKHHLLVAGKFPVTQFTADYDKTSVSIGGNTATDKHLAGHVTENGHEVSWDLAFAKKWKFAAMGWSMTVPNLSGIYWYPAQASAVANGWIRFDGTLYELNNAPAYQDRNWGRNFPKWWTWLTSNHFENSPGTTLAAGGGEPKVFNSVYLFSGLCIGLKHQGKEYIFRTTDLDFINFNIGWGVWNVAAQNSRGQKIEISAYAPPDQFMMLPFQSPRGPQFYDYEALMGKMTVKVFERSSIFDKWHAVADLTTLEAGIEWGTPEPLESNDPYSMRTLFSSMTNLQ